MLEPITVRPWLPSLEGKIESDLGPVGYSLTDGNHVYLSVDVDGVHRDVVFRDSSYYAALHLYLIDGVWTPRDRDSLSMSKRGDFSRKPVPKTYRKKLIASWTAAWTAFVTPEMLAQAADRSFSNQCLTLEAKQNTVLREIEALKKEWEEVHASHGKVAPPLF